MPGAVFFNVPAHGHINPSLPLVEELTRRGHEITYFTTASYRERVEKAGASVEIYDGVQDDYFESQNLNGSDPTRAARELMKTTRSLLPDLLERVRQLSPDYILYDCMCPWGYFVGQIMNLPTVSSASLMPISPRILLNPRMLRHMFPMIIKTIRESGETGQILKELGAHYNVKPLDRMMVLNAPGDLVISYSSDLYVPYANTLPDNVKLIGWNQPNPTNQDFARESTRPLVYVSLGTVNNDNEAFFRLCIRALADQPYDVLITTGGGLSSEHFGELPENITFKKWVPQTQVLKQASVFITHGGLNSVHEGLYCGLPLLIVPQQTEQTINGVIVVNLGAGLMLTPKQVNAEALREAIQTLLHDSQYKTKAQHIAESLRSAGGVTRAVDEIENLVR